MMKSITIKAFYILLFLNLAILAQAQNSLSLSGVVLDKQTNEPLINAILKEKGTNNGVVTDLDGNFNIKINKGNILTIQYLGYQTKEIRIETSDPLTIHLDESSKELGEVVVVGYGVQKKSDITGSISSITGKELSNIPVSSALQAIQGKAAGVQVIQNTGAPGGSTTIKIRGTGTVNDEEPLYVVDGFIVDDINHINPNDIANIEILKDAASSAVYGARSANGVVIVTTKKGESGKLKINFDAYTGISSPWKKIEVMDVANFALMRDYVDGTSYYSSDGRLCYSKDPSTSEYFYDAGKFQRIDTIRTNSPSSWWDAITQTGFKQQYNISLSGGGDQNKYMISANYYDEKGIVKNSDYKRFTTRVNSFNKLSKWLTMNANLLYTNETRNRVPEGETGVLKRSLHQNPLVYTYNSAGYYSESHPLAAIERNHDKSQRHRIDLNLDLTAKISKHLNYQFKIADYVSFENRDRFSEVNKLEESFTMPTDLTTMRRDQFLTNKLEINNLLTFSWNDEIHDISAVAGHVIEDYKYDYHDATSRGADGNSSNFWYLSSGYIAGLPHGYNKDWSALGFVGRINYNLLDRYLFQLNFRGDRSSKFSKQERWGFFPAASVGWKFSSESFLNENDWLSLGKLRIGWGKLGNNRIDEYARYTIILNNYNYAFGNGNHILYPGATASSLGNPNITWEKTESYNIGLDFSFLNNRLSGSVEYFDKLTTDMLLRVPVSISAGQSNATINNSSSSSQNSGPMTNAGSVKNKGIEFSISYKGGSKFTYDVGFNISYIKNKVVSLGSSNEPIYSARLSEASILDYVTKTEVGRPIGSFYGYMTDGIFSTIEEVKNSVQYEVGKNEQDQTTRPGDFRFVDVNKDGKITADDRVYLGSPHPDFVFGIPLNFGYENFDLSIFLQGQTGNKIFNVMEYYLNSAHGTGNVYADIRSKHWSGKYRSDREFFPENMNASIPDLDATDAPRNFRASNFYVKDGSYLRLQNVRLTYNFPSKIRKWFSVSDLSAYIGAYNLLTFTKYNGLDPEVGKNVGSENNNLYMGVDHGNYPQARSFILGVKFSL